MSDASTLDLEQLAGQRLMVGFDGTAMNADLEYLIDKLKVGGLILFARNVTDPDQVRTLCADAQTRAATCGQPPLFIAIDQEGGQVARLKAPFTEFPGTPPLASTADADRFARITARELADIGLNMNMAPVMDVADPDIDSIMRKRAFSHDPEIVAEIGLAVVDGLQRRQIMAVAKHFPGIGRTTLDSHIHQPVLDAPVESLQIDLAPFQAAINNQVAGIMLSHIIYSALDAEYPASLSVKIARDLLREKMGYDGLVMTDDLDMGAVTGHFDIPTATDRILAADIDLTLVCHKGPARDEAFEQTLAWLGSRPNREERGRKSVERILRLKSSTCNESWP